MRKMKKINGYLVVRFNDRERREYPELGGFGVIDAEQYTGEIDIDLCAMEYSDADTLEAAAEQARGLESEEDLAEEAPVITVSVETNSSYTEEIVVPEQLIRGMEARLRAQIQGRAGLDPAAAVHELHGFKTALHRLGFLPEIETQVDPDYFTDCAPAAEEPDRLAYICDELCRHRASGCSQEAADEICARCKVPRWAAEPPVPASKGVQKLQVLLNGINDYTKTPAPPGDRFRHLVWPHELEPYVQGIYRLGRLLEEDCPDDNCMIYRDIFYKARKLDDALDTATGYAAEVMQKELRSLVLELRRLYHNNSAIAGYRNSREAGV